MTAPSAAVAGVGVYTPHAPNVAGWLSPASSSMTDPVGGLIDKRSRRRASQLTRAFADVFEEACNAAALDPVSVAAVFGSALGEASTMISLLDAMWREQAEMSPMSFAMSVHNAAAGVVSIATANRGFTTSLGADFDTPAAALQEAFGVLLATGTPVVVVCGDEAAPAKLVPDDLGWGAATVAVALVPCDVAPADAPRITFPEIAGPTIQGADLTPRLALNPQAGLLDLVDAILRRRSGVVALDRGQGSGWTVSVRCSGP